eukprot:556845-Pelagomonas_calceolata.AAC.3
MAYKAKLHVIQDWVKRDGHLVNQSVKTLSLQLCKSLFGPTLSSFRVPLDRRATLYPTLIMHPLPLFTQL